MKRLTLIIGFILLVLNLVVGLIVSAYDIFNMYVNCCVIAVTTGFLFLLSTIRLCDAFRISLCFLFVVIGIFEFILGCLIPQQVQGNWYLLAEIILLSFEVLMIMITYFITNKNL